MDGCGIVQFQSEYFVPNPTFYDLKERSKHRCPGQGLVPARRVAWGGASTGRRFLGFQLDVIDWELKLCYLDLYEAIIMGLILV